MPYYFVIRSRGFKRTHCFRLRGSRSLGRIRDLLTSGDEVSASLRIVAIRSPRDAERRPRRTENQFHIMRPAISVQSTANFSFTIILRASFNASERPYQNIYNWTYRNNCFPSLIHVLPVRPAVTKMWSTSPKGSAAIFKGIRGHNSVMAILKLTYFLY